MLGTVYGLTMTPVYEANILLQIKRNAPGTGDPQADVPAATEMEILRSRSIVSRVVNTLHLDISVEPKLFPMVGAFIAGKNQKISTPGLFGQGGYVWGAEQVTIPVFSVPSTLLSTSFMLTITGKDEFTLSQQALAIRVRGRVGELTKIQTKYGPVVIQVTEIKSRPGAQFFVSRWPEFQVVEQLQKSLAVLEKARQSNVIAVSLRGSKPELISRILNEIGKEYIHQQVVQKSEAARKELVFYDQQVEESKLRLQKLDARLAEVLRRHGTSDLSEEARTLAQQSVALQAKLAETEQKKVDLSSRFAELHPEVLNINKHLADVHRDLNSIEAKRKAVAAAQQEILSLNRDKQVNSEINVELLNARHKLDALSLSNSVNVRLVDRAEPPSQPVTLRLSVMIVMSCLLGIVLGVVASILKNTLAERSIGVAEVESVRRLVISAGMPHCDDRDRKHRKSAEQ
jgi:tyrosine-protein kinase Etk/Wzc